MLLYIIKIIHFAIIFSILCAPFYNQNYYRIMIILLALIIIKWKVYGGCALTKLEYILLGHEDEKKGFIYRLINPFFSIEQEKWREIFDNLSILWLILLIIIYILRFHNDNNM